MCWSKCKFNGSTLEHLKIQMEFCFCEAKIYLHFTGSVKYLCEKKCVKAVNNQSELETIAFLYYSLELHACIF